MDDVVGAQVSDTGSPGMNAFVEGIGEHTSNSAVTAMATPVRFVVDGAMVTLWWSSTYEFFKSVRSSLTSQEASLMGLRHPTQNSEMSWVRETAKLVETRLRCHTRG